MYEKLDQTIEGVIAKLSKNEDDDTVDQIVDLMIRYYESDTLRIILDTIQQAAPDEVERLSRLLAKYGAARVGEVAQMLHTQLEVIELLRTKVDEGVLEAEIHKIIAENIWLIRDDLTYWFSNRQFATKLQQNGERVRVCLRQAPGSRLLRQPDAATDARRTANSAARCRVQEARRKDQGSKELQQVMLYKNVFEAALGDISGDDVDVMILGDEFDAAFDRKAIAYKIMSYEELLANARDRYRDLYERLAPDGIPPTSAEPAPSTRVADVDGSKPKRARRRRVGKAATARGRAASGA